MATSMTTTQKSIDWDAATREATEILSRYVRIDSSHPRGRTVETAALFADHLAAEGISYRIYESPEEGKVNLVARLSAANPEGKPLMLSNHMDVVQAIPEDWRFPPFSGEVADGSCRNTSRTWIPNSSSTRAARGCASSSARATPSRFRSPRS